MKKITISIVLLILVIVIFRWNNVSNSGIENHKENEQVSIIIDNYSEKYGHEFKLNTKEIEHSLYGKWLVGETIGYSLKYDITGGALDYSVIEISEDQLSIQYSEKTFKDSYSDKYDTPIFIYYQETLDKMKQDDFLDNYSGIEGLDLDTIGTIVTVIGKSTNFHDKYEAIPIKFIIINDHIIAVRQSTFYKLQKLNP